MITFEIKNAVTLFFHVFMFFVVVYSALGIFALLRYGQSKGLGFLTFTVYALIVGSLYLQALTIISRF